MPSILEIVFLVFNGILLLGGMIVLNKQVLTGPRAKSRKILRVTILLGYVQTLIFFATYDLLNQSLPIEYQEYLARRLAEPVVRSEEIFLFFGLPFFIGGLLAPIGLFFFKKWAVVLSLLSWLGLSVSTSGQAPDMDHNIVETILSTGGMIYGFTLGVIFLTNAIYDREQDMGESESVRTDV